MLRFSLNVRTELGLPTQVLTTIANEPKSGLILIYVGRVISGFGIGGVSAVAPAYVSECAPKEVRGRITGMFQIMVSASSGSSIPKVTHNYTSGRYRGHDIILHQLYVSSCCHASHCTEYILITVGVGLHMANNRNVWMLPFGFQLVPAGIMLMGLFTVKVRVGHLFCFQKDKRMRCHVLISNSLGISQMAGVSWQKRRGSS